MRRAAGRRAVRELARAAAVPALCAAAVIGLLSGWVSISGAGTLSRVQLKVTFAALPLSPGAAAGGTTAPYLTIRNFSGQDYELTGASSPAADRVTLHRDRDGLRAGPGRAGLIIPAHATVTLSPLGSDIELAGTRLLRAGELVPLTLVFGQAGRVTVHATVTPAGVP